MSSAVLAARRTAPRHSLRATILIALLMAIVGLSIALPTIGSFATDAAGADCSRASATRVEVVMATAEGDPASGQERCRTVR